MSKTKKQLSHDLFERVAGITPPEGDELQKNFVPLDEPRKPQIRAYIDSEHYFVRVEIASDSRGYAQAFIQDFILPALEVQAKLDRRADGVYDPDRVHEYQYYDVSVEMASSPVPQEHAFVIDGHNHQPA